MEPMSFQFILDLIKDNHIFINKSNCEQDLIFSQLKITLYKLVHNRNSSRYIPACWQWGIFESHISNYVCHIVYTLFQIQEKYIW